MRTIRLCKGAGNGVDTACLATATAIIAGEPASQKPLCVCPTIAAFARLTNDAMDDDTRSHLYGDLPWMLVGTRSTPEIERRRAYMCADWAVRTIAPIALRAVGREEWAQRLASLDPIVDERTACAAGHACAAAADAADAAYAAHAAYGGARGGAAARAAARACDAASDAVRSAAAGAAGHAAYAARAAYGADRVWPLCRQLILDMIAVDPPAPVEPAVTEDEMVARFGEYVGA